jgi:hypothetical protein
VALVALAKLLLAWWSGRRPAAHDSWTRSTRGTKEAAGSSA